MCQAPSCSQPAPRKAAHRRAVQANATKSKGFGAMIDLLQIQDVSCKETLREGDKVHVEVSVGPEETLKAFNSVASKTQRRTPEDAHRRRVSHAMHASQQIQACKDTRHGLQGCMH